MNSSDLSPPVPVAIMLEWDACFLRAENLARFWAILRKGIDSIIDVPESHWRASDYFDNDPKAPDRTYAHRGGFLTPVDFPLLDFGIAPNSVEATDTTQLLGLMVARQALDDAGCMNNPTLDRDKVQRDPGRRGRNRAPVIPLGARLGHPIWRRADRGPPASTGRPTTKMSIERIASSYCRLATENSFPGLLGNVAAGRIANRLDLRRDQLSGRCRCAVRSPARSTWPRSSYCRAVRSELSPAGSIHLMTGIFMYMCFSKTPALSPTGDARPFDAEADGTILGEGIGVMVLSCLDDSGGDGDRIYAVIRAMGSSSDGKGQAVYAPSTVGQAKALKQAYQLAGVSPATVELVEAHGTGTKVGDAIELGGPRANSSGGPAGGLVARLGIGQIAGGAHE